MELKCVKCGKLIKGNKAYCEECEKKIIEESQSVIEDDVKIKDTKTAKKNIDAEIKSGYSSFLGCLGSIMVLIIICMLINSCMDNSSREKERAREEKAYNTAIEQMHQGK